jgi:AraC family transcriptional regulator
VVFRLTTDERLPADLLSTEPRLSASIDLTNEVIRGLLQRLGEELRHPGFSSDVLMELVAGQLAIELQRHCGKLSSAEHKGGLSPWRLRLIEERLREVSAPPTLSELAASCKLSVRQLTRGFRVSRGCSIGDYINTSRVECAKRLLARGDNVQGVAAALGFASASSFCFAFRRATGRTPNQYRVRGHRDPHSC